MRTILAQLVICGLLALFGILGSAYRQSAAVVFADPVVVDVSAKPADASTAEATLSDDASPESAPLDIAPHKFVASVDTSLLCDICKEPEYHKNHKVSDEQVSVDTITNVDCKCDICKCVDCKCGSEDLQPKAVATAGHWVLVNVPVYGPLGRQRGSQQVWQWQGPQQAPVNYGRAYSSCANGQCGR